LTQEELKLSRKQRNALTKERTKAAQGAQGDAAHGISKGIQTFDTFRRRRRVIFCLNPTN